MSDILKGRLWYWLKKKVSEKLSVSKRVTPKFDVERFNLKEPNYEKVKIKIWKSFAALEHLGHKGDIDRIRETVWENMKTSAKGSLGHY
jgi:hypothetical protein